MKMTFSDEIRNCKDGVVSNPYQGKDKKVLFVCSMGILRSATAARIYANRFNTRCAGTYSDALIPLSPILVAWADEIVFVNKENFEMFAKSVDDVSHYNITVLDISDEYEHMHPKLIEEFEKQYAHIKY